MSDRVIPSFFRVEIAAGSRNDLLRATAEMRKLADEIDFIAGQYKDDPTALVLAYHKVKTASKTEERKLT